MNRLFLVTGILLVLTACASVESFLDKNSAAAQIVVEEATARVIQAGTSAITQKARAQSIAAIVTQVKQTFDTQAQTLPELVALVTTRVAALKLSPADAILSQALITQLSALLQQKVCPGTDPATACTIPAAQTAYVDSFLGWILSATALYTV